MGACCRGVGGDACQLGMPGDDGPVCAKLNDLPQAKQHLEEALKIDEKLRISTPAERVEIPEITSKSGI